MTNQHDIWVINLALHDVARLAPQISFLSCAACQNHAGQPDYGIHHASMSGNVVTVRDIASMAVAAASRRW